MNKIESYVWENAEQFLIPLAIELADVEYLKEGSNWFLRIYIDKTDETKVSLEDCEKASRLLSEHLEEAVDRLTDKPYILEVSSPGIERVLKRPKDFKRFVKNMIVVKLYEQKNRSKMLKGLLLESDSETITLEVNNEKIKILYEEIAKANLYFEF